jgi:hypothetical protein
MPQGASIGCACAASPDNWACESAGIRPGTAINAATSRLLRGTPPREGVVWESCLGGMYRFGELARPPAPATTILRLSSTTVMVSDPSIKIYNRSNDEAGGKA